MNRQKLVLALLLVALAGSLVYSYVKFPRQREAAPQGPARPAATPAAKGTPERGAGGTTLRLDRLEQAQPGSVGSRRNIFSPIFREEVTTPAFKPLPPPPKPATSKAPPPLPEAVAPAPAPPPPPTPEQLAEAEMAKITFLGFLKKNGEKTVFLSHNNEIFLAKRGSTIANRFVVSNITDDAISIRPVAGGREVVIPLVENRPLGRPGSRMTPP